MEEGNPKRKYHTHRKQHENLEYAFVFDQILEKIGNNYIRFKVDETTDTCGRFTANFLIGVMNDDIPTVIFNFKQIEENHCRIARFRMKIINAFGLHMFNSCTS